MRKSDIAELLVEVEGIIETLEYQRTMANVKLDILEVSKPKVKSCLEHLRSCLEYAAHDVYDKVYKDNDGKTNEQRERMKIYFPYGKNLGDFHSNLGRSFKDLKTKNKEIYELILSIQSFNSRTSWLYDICNITNKIKHVEQRKQDRVSMRTVNMSNAFNLNFTKGSNTNIFISGNIINGVKQNSDVIIDRGQVRNNILVDRGLLEVVDWTDFVFKNSKIKVLELIRSSLENIKAFSHEMYIILDC
jgi:predicted component of type VI protein secretion system